MFGQLEEELRSRGVADELIARVKDSGYFLKAWATMSGQPHYTVSDSLYGNKGLSSSFELERFIRHISGEPAFDPLPPLNRIRVRNRREIEEYLQDQRLQRYQSEGSLTMRGQPREHWLRRAIPNPVRATAEGKEISILPGLYRQSATLYSLETPFDEQRSIEAFRDEIESAPDEGLHAFFARDFLHVEQHYARQTAGLDVTFSIESAIFFATNKFMINGNGHARYEAVHRGDHQGVIYLFRFGSPSVRRTEFLIKDFDYFRTNQPVRVIRQVCGLPYFESHERNIAVTDVDTVIELEQDFDGESSFSAEHMFPNVAEDKFYGRLLTLKSRFPKALEDVVEYKWARPEVE